MRDAVALEVAVGVVLPFELAVVTRAAAIRIDALYLVGAVDDVADGVDPLVTGVPLIEAGQVTRARA